jgi:hypothetical protein
MYGIFLEGKDHNNIYLLLFLCYTYTVYLIRFMQDPSTIICLAVKLLYSSTVQLSSKPYFLPSLERVEYRIFLNFGNKNKRWNFLPFLS